MRTNNEDNFWCCGVRLPVHNQGVDGILAGHTQHWQLPMLAVFDGMGGESYGEMAASAAVEALGGFYEENKKTLKKEPVVFLTGACENMNEAVCRYSNENGIRSMGTTMALLSFSEKAIYACNLGDSRIYRHFQGKFQQISTDHVIGGKMLGKAPLTQYLGFQEENMALEPSIVEIGYQPGSSYIPKALLYCIPTLMVIYGGVAIVASGVLPLDQVAGQPLTLVAKNILNPALFTVFMIGGPVLALSSSINSTISNNCIPVAQSCKDGWLPKSWAAQNRRGAYWKLMTFTYLMGILPVLLDFSISDVVNNIMLLASAVAFLQIYAYFQLPKKHAEAWEKSPMHISNGKYYFLCCLSLFAYICIFINSCRSLKLPVVIISLIAIVVCMAYGWFRSVSPDVKMETSVWED